MIKISDNEFIGPIPIRQDIEVLPADKAKQLVLGWSITENIGIGIINIKRKGIINIKRKYLICG
jgi:hypothetical protein